MSSPSDAIIDLEELYLHAPCGYFSLSPAGKIIKINDTLLNWLGFSREELLEQKFATLLSKGGQMHFEMFFWPIAAVNKGVKEFSYEIIKKNEQVLPVLLNASTKFNPEGKLLAVNIVLTDITERKNFEQDLLRSKKAAEEEKKRLQFMADLVPEIIWTATAEGNIDYVNARFCQYFDCNGKDTRFAFILSKVHPDDLKELWQLWHKSVKSGEAFQKNVRLRNVAGAYEWHNLKAALFLAEEGKMTNWFGSCSNIEDHLSALKKKDDFISIASHELKTPITSLKAVLQLLDRMKKDLNHKMAPDLIEKANKNVNKVNDLVSDLLNASQINEGQLQLKKTTVNLSELIGDCVHHIRISNDFEILTEGDKSIMVSADEGRIEQVITNFITNAIKYAPESKRIVMNISEKPDQVLVEVTDKGPGIATEKIRHLFDRYYQVASSGSKYSGLGLGLYICAEIIRKHGGDIGARSEVGRGSTFWFSLPKV